jgi:hypothetical protein
MTDGAAELTDHAREDLRLLYQVVVQDLAFFKQQQWSVTNYVLLLQAALVGLVTQLTGSTTKRGERIAVCVLAAILGFVGVFLLIKLEQSIKLRRVRLSNVRARLSQEFRDCWETPAKPPESATIAVVLGAAMVLGTVIVHWLVWRPIS